jgi:hypothetical protein
MRLLRGGAIFPLLAPRVQAIANEIGSGADGIFDVNQRFLRADLYPKSLELSLQLPRCSSSF